MSKKTPNQERGVRPSTIEKVIPVFVENKQTNFLWVADKPIGFPDCKKQKMSTTELEEKLRLKSHFSLNHQKNPQKYR